VGHDDPEMSVQDVHVSSLSIMFQIKLIYLTCKGVKSQTGNM